MVRASANPSSRRKCTELFYCYFLRDFPSYCEGTVSGQNTLSIKRAFLLQGYITIFFVPLKMFSLFYVMKAKDRVREKEKNDRLSYFRIGEVFVASSNLPLS